MTSIERDRRHRATDEHTEYRVIGRLVATCGHEIEITSASGAQCTDEQCETCSDCGTSARVTVMSEPQIFWTLNPADERTHATVSGDHESLCGVALPEGQACLHIPWGLLCLPCAIGATADLPDPGRMGTGLWPRPAVG